MEPRDARMKAISLQYTININKVLEQMHMTLMVVHLQVALIGLTAINNISVFNCMNPGKRGFVSYSSEQ